MLSSSGGCPASNFGCGIAKGLEGKLVGGEGDRPTPMAWRWSLDAT